MVGEYRVEGSLGTSLYAHGFVLFTSRGSSSNENQLQIEAWGCAAEHARIANRPPQLTSAHARRRNWSPLRPAPPFNTGGRYAAGWSHAPGWALHASKRGNAARHRPRGAFELAPCYEAHSNGLADGRIGRLGGNQQTQGESTDQPKLSKTHAQRLTSKAMPKAQLFVA